MWPNPQETAHLVTFTEEILYGKLHFLYSGSASKSIEKSLIRFSTIENRDLSLLRCTTFYKQLRSALKIPFIFKILKAQNFKVLKILKAHCLTAA